MGLEIDLTLYILTIYIIFFFIIYFKKLYVNINPYLFDCQIVKIMA